MECRLCEAFLETMHGIVVGCTEQFPSKCTWSLREVANLFYINLDRKFQEKRLKKASLEKEKLFLLLNKNSNAKVL